MLDNSLMNSKMSSSNYMSTCGSSAFPSLFQKARGIRSPWRLHQKSVHMDKLVLQSSYSTSQPAPLSSLHQRGISIGCAAESNLWAMSELRQGSPRAGFWSRKLVVSSDVYKQKNLQVLKYQCDTVFVQHGMLADTLIVLPELLSIKNKWSMLLSVLQKRSGGW